MENTVELPSDDELSYISVNSDDSCILLSPAITRSQVETFRDETMTPPSRYPLLESVSARFEQNKSEMAERIGAKRVRREVELAHSQYLRQNVASPEHMAEARATVQSWAHKHNTIERSNRQILQAKRRFTSSQRSGLFNSSVEILSPSVLSSPLRSSRSSMTMGRSNSDNGLSVLPGPAYAASSSHGQEMYNCKVLNCDMEFSSMVIYNQHQNQIIHTPCNPLRHFLNNTIPLVPDVFMCPKCNQCMKTKERCKKHMQENSHLEFLDPLSVGGYMCRQCLLIFSDMNSCWKHMHSYCHGDVVYPFQDDISSDTSDINPPVPTSIELCNDFQARCLQVPMTVSCVDCNLTVRSDSEQKQHQLKFRGNHVLSCSATGTIVEVFSQYLTGYSCAKCTSVCALPENEQDEHQCGSGFSGAIIENCCKTFEDFVKCCSISLSLKKTQEQSESPLEVVTTVPVQESTWRVSSRREIDLNVKTAIKDGLSFGGSQNNNGLINDTSLDKVPLCYHSPPKRPCKELSLKAGSPSKKTKSSNVTDSSSEEYNNPDQVMSEGSDNGQCKQKTTMSLQSVYKTENCSKKDKCSILFKNSLKSICSKKEGQLADKSTAQSKQSMNRTSKPFENVLMISQPSSTSQNFADSLSVDTKSIQSSGENGVAETAIDFMMKSCRKSDLTRTNDVNLNTGLTDGFNENSTCPSSDGNNVASTSANSKCTSLIDPEDQQNPIPFEVVDVDSSFSNELSANSNFPASDTSVSSSHAHQKHTSSIDPGNNQNNCINFTSRPNIHSGLTATQVVDLDSYCTTVLSTTSAAQNVSSVSWTQPKLTSPVDVENLEKMKQILFLDIDNWPKLFQKLPTPLPERTFVWGFYGGRNNWIEPRLCPAFSYQKEHGWFYLHEKCGSSKDAADFAICLMVGRMDERLPKHIPFTILSGDKGFHELERQMSISNRRAVVIDPHSASAFSGTMIYTMVTSVSDM